MFAISIFKTAFLFLNELEHTIYCDISFSRVRQSFFYSRFMNVYCVFCKTGKERATAKELGVRLFDAQVLAPAKIVQERRRGVWESCERVLMPSYVFIYSEDVIDWHIVNGSMNAISLLRYSDGSSELSGNDLDFAMWFYRQGGLINVSEVLVEGDEVKVLSGPLMDSVGTITRFDRHKRKVWISIDFMGQNTVLSVSVNEVSKEALIAG